MNAILDALTADPNVSPAFKAAMGCPAPSPAADKIAAREDRPYATPNVLTEPIVFVYRHWTVMLKTKRANGTTMYSADFIKPDGSAESLGVWSYLQRSAELAAIEAIDRVEKSGGRP